MIWFSTIVFLTVLYGLMVLGYRIGWKRMPEHNLRVSEASSDGVKPRLSVTVIVPARNEAAGIAHTLTDLQRQSYVDYEVIVVDDHSTDETAEVVEEFAKEFPRLRLLSLREMLAERGREVKAFKKEAIALAIEAAEGELIVTTDADCRLGERWLEEMVAYFAAEELVMVSGPVAYFNETSLLGRFQDLDFMSLVGIGGACIELGMYNLCNGANLAYTREAFYKVDGFKGIDGIPSGDDMMLMHKLGREFPGKIGFLKSKAAIVRTRAESSLRAFWQQRLRWASKSTNYEDLRVTILLIMVYLFNLSILVNLLIGFWHPFFLRLAAGQFVVKLLADTAFQYPVAKFFHKQHLLWSILPLQAAHIIYVIFAGPWSTFGQYQWKGRTVAK